MTDKSIQRNNAVLDTEKDEQALLRNAEIVRSMPDNIADVLMKARVKPVWCSDIRWRMELRRRKRYYRSAF